MAGVSWERLGGWLFLYALAVRTPCCVKGRALCNGGCLSLLLFGGTPTLIFSKALSASFLFSIKAENSASFLFSPPPPPFVQVLRKVNQKEQSCFVSGKEGGGERRAVEKMVAVSSKGSCRSKAASFQRGREYAPSVFEKYTCSITVGKKEVLLHLYDTAGQEDYDRLRPLSYQGTSVVLVCYDVMNPTSFDNVLIKWSHEVSHFCQGTPIVLVGCKTDLRKDKEQLRKLRSTQQEPITYSQGEEARRQMNADAYLECSAKHRENIEDIFREAASIALNAMKKKQQKKLRPCALL
ncbi:rho-related GTP-binding protein RhoF isoform X1 [Paroedura picta]|uniref:rho-related GTP-binding protein RhoF isoform X1 n=1 Tax=Paroedura picta TaxID=143630 RepID=UPI00405765F7